MVSVYNPLLLLDFPLLCAGNESSVARLTISIFLIVSLLSGNHLLVWPQSIVQHRALHSAMHKLLDLLQEAIGKKLPQKSFILLLTLCTPNTDDDIQQIFHSSLTDEQIHLSWIGL